MAMLDRIVAADEERREAIRAEIAAKGTRWAAEEIDRLRRALASRQSAEPSAER